MSSQLLSPSCPAPADIAREGAFVTVVCVEYQPLSFFLNHLFFPILLPPGSPAGVCRPENGLLPADTTRLSLSWPCPGLASLVCPPQGGFLSFGACV